jgi:hypothetical protein
MDHPEAARRRQMAEPMPPVAPVTKATLLRSAGWIEDIWIYIENLKGYRDDGVWFDSTCDDWAGVSG